MEDKALTQWLESYSRDLAEFRADVTARLDGILERLDIVSIRLDRQGALIQTGSRNAVRQNTWSEHVDRTLNRLAKRLENLEAKPPKPAEGA
jgi:hypothetical protein